ncbi:transglutaminase-like domain-containing protein [Ostreibacterium oceani]|nr:transglutaminase domain-containing protein [Ostreibacterium oceani]
MMAYPAYGEVERIYDEYKLNQKRIVEVADGESLADIVTEMKKLLTTLNPNKTPEVAAAYEILEMTDPVLKQGESKQRDRLQTLFDALPDKYQAELDGLKAEKAKLEAKNNPELDSVITGIDAQIVQMQANYKQLITLVDAYEDRSFSAKASAFSQSDLLTFINQFDSAPQQQTKNGPTTFKQTFDSISESKPRRKVTQFLSDRATSVAQLKTAETLEKISSNSLLFVEKSLSRPPNFQSPLKDSRLYRGESDEVQLTDRIKEKAAELDYDPVKIYYWVRNNIEFVPTWGAYQTAEHTLGSRQGNAFDTASLLIAMLRASNIPARYVHGTIEVAPEKFQNWVGDFDDIESAATYAGTLGSRVVTLRNRNTNMITAVELEHVWVEAAIDFHPSRGMINKVADTWLPMDASFKQYEYLEGIDVEAVGELNAEQLFNDFQNSGTVNEDEGWVQGLDGGIIEQAQKDAQAKVEAHIERMTDPTVGDVIGGNKVIIKEYPVLGANLENHIVVRGTDYIEVPTNYQAQIGLAMQKVLSSGLIPIPQPDITPNLKYYPLSQFNSEKLILRFTPATEADQAALDALIPEDADSIDDLPSAIGNGINVTPELVLNGEVIMAGQTLAISEEVELGIKARLPNTRNSYPTLSYDVIAGSYLNIPVVGYSVNPYRLLDTRDKVENTQSILESESETQLASLTRDDILGDLVYTGGLGYFAQLHSMNRMLSNQSTDIGRDLVGYGSYGYEPKLRQAGLLAQPTGILPGSMATNVRVHQASWRKSKDEPFTNIDFAMGMNSSLLESAISEQLFCNEEVNPDNNECYGISTVSGLQRAAAQGQKIYQIDKNNREQLANVRMSDENMADDINRAISSGGYAIVPEKAVDGVGRSAIYVYMTYNGQTGNQSWKISGGLNGGDFHLQNALSAILGIAAVMKDSFGTPDVIFEYLNDTKLFDLLGKLFAAFGIIMDFAELAAECGKLLAAAISGLLAAIGYYITTMATLVFASFSTLFLGLALTIIVTGILIPIMLNEMKKFAKNLVCRENE